MASQPIDPNELEQRLEFWTADITRYFDMRVDALSRQLRADRYVDQQRFATIEERLSSIEAVQTEIREEQTKIREEQAKIREEQTKIREEQTKIREDQEKMRHDLESVVAFQTTLLETFKGMQADILKQMADGFAIVLERLNDQQRQIDELKGQR